MTKYMDLHKGSNISSYEILPSAIIIRYKSSGSKFVYSYDSCGMENVENLKSLALKGSGLQRYIMLNVADEYDKELSIIKRKPAFFIKLSHLKRKIFRKK